MELANFKYGHTEFPVSSSRELLVACDPAVAKMLDFFAFMIETYVGQAIVSAAATVTSSADIRAAPLERAVMSTIPIDPMSIAKPTQFKFPLLAVWRKTARFDQRTMNWWQDTATIGVAYVLPPLSAGQATRVQPALTAVSRILHTAIVRGFDPSYNDSERVFQTIETARTKLTGGTFERFEFGDTTDFHAFIGDIELHEQTMPLTTGLATLEGVDAVITDESVEPGSPIDMIDLTLPQP